MLFEHFKANHSFAIQRAFRPYGRDSSAQTDDRRTISDRMSQLFTHEYENPALPLELLVNHSVSSLLSLVTWWLENDMPYSTEEMAGLL